MVTLSLSRLVRLGDPLGFLMDIENLLRRRRIERLHLLTERRGERLGVILYTGYPCEPSFFLIFLGKRDSLRRLLAYCTLSVRRLREPAPWRLRASPAPCPR